MSAQIVCLYVFWDSYGFDRLSFERACSDDLGFMDRNRISSGESYFPRVVNQKVVVRCHEGVESGVRLGFRSDSDHPTFVALCNLSRHSFPGEFPGFWVDRQNFVTDLHFGMTFPSPSCQNLCLGIEARPLEGEDALVVRDAVEVYVTDVLAGSEFLFCLQEGAFEEGIALRPVHRRVPAPVGLPVPAHIHHVVLDRRAVDPAVVVYLGGVPLVYPRVQFPDSLDHLILDP